MAIFATPGFSAAFDGLIDAAHWLCARNGRMLDNGPEVMLSLVRGGLSATAADLDVSVFCLLSDTEPPFISFSSASARGRSASGFRKAAIWRFAPVS